MADLGTFFKLVNLKPFPGANKILKNMAFREQKTEQNPTLWEKFDRC